MLFQASLSIAAVTGILYVARVATNPQQFGTVAYEDLQKLNATCPESDNCTEGRYVDILDFYNCNCGEFCSKYGTCCVDSKHRGAEVKIRKQYNCVKVYGSKPVFMIDSCDTAWIGDNHTEELCLSSAEDEEDLFLALPVTNHVTGDTYRNYYCAVCNNETEKEELTPWSLSLTSKNKDIMSMSSPDLHFHRSLEIWTIGNDTDNILNDTVNLIVKVPKEVKKMVHNCLPDVTSSCASDWTDADVEGKCAAYMSLVGILASDGNRKTYRNPHCAICNYESLDEKYCSGFDNLTILNRAPSNTFFVRLFSLYDKENKCESEQVYDTIAKKCRKVYKG